MGRERGRAGKRRRGRRREPRARRATAAPASPRAVPDGPAASGRRVRALPLVAVALLAVIGATAWRMRAWTEATVRTIDADLDAEAPADTVQARGASGAERVSRTRRWVTRAFTDDERTLLRVVFGVDDPARLYFPTDEATPVLRYDAVQPTCTSYHTRGGRLVKTVHTACRPIAARVGLAAPRRPDETWDAFVSRVRRDGPRAWPDAAQHYYTSLASLDPDARAAFERLVADARAEGFRVRVAETYRSPERHALLLARADGRTAAATSVHSYGRAADLVIDDGRPDRPATARRWIAFRRWVLGYRDGMFRLVGTPDDTWDWPHVELAEPVLGYRSVDEALAAARVCRDAASSDADAAARCTFAPHLPTRGAVSDTGPRAGPR